MENIRPVISKARPDVYKKYVSCEADMHLEVS